MELFLPESGLMIWMLIGFLIVLFILAKVGWPMIMGAVTKRNQHISDSLVAAQEANNALAGIEAAKEKAIAESQAEQLRIIKESQELKSQLVEEAKAAAHAEAELFKTFFSQIPASLIEAAEIDGASQKRIFVSIILPMSKPIVASIFFSGMLGRWNDYSRSLYYISDKNLFDLQYFLQNALQSASFLKQTYANNPSFANDAIPVETLKFALSIISCLPVVLIFPYIQKFYSKGMAVGAVKE